MEKNNKINIFLKEVSGNLKICWSNFLVSGYDMFGDPDILFKIEPLKYVEFAKLSLRDETAVSLINSLTNSKRAIDAQIDTLISFLGYDYKKFNDKNTKEYINNRFTNKQFDGITEKIKLLNILGLAPTLLLSKIRTLRNSVEHEYEVPSKLEVEEAIEVAELFINSSTRKINITNRGILFGSNYSDFYIGTENFYSIHPKYAYIEFLERKYFKFVYVENNKNEKGELYLPYYGNLDENNHFIIGVDDNIYVMLLEIMFNSQYDLLPRLFGYQIDNKVIKYKIGHC